jgi:hypothetical protein
LATSAGALAAGAGAAAVAGGVEGDAGAVDAGGRRSSTGARFGLEAQALKTRTIRASDAMRNVERDEEDNIDGAIDSGMGSALKDAGF